MQKNKIQAIFDEDLIDVLKKMGQLQKIDNGQVFCHSCGSLITIKNIQIVIPYFKTEFLYICNNPACVEKFYSKQPEIKK